MQQLVASKALKAPSPYFPKWVVNADSVPILLTKLRAYKADAYFANVIARTTTLPGTKRQSQKISASIFNVLLASVTSRFINQPIYIDNGIKMLRDLDEQFDPSKPEHQLNDI